MHKLFDHFMIIKCDDFTFPINCDIALHWILQLDQFKERKTHGLVNVSIAVSTLEWIVIYKLQNFLMPQYNIQIIPDYNHPHRLQKTRTILAMPDTEFKQRMTILQSSQII